MSGLFQEVYRLLRGRILLWEELQAMLTANSILLQDELLQDLLDDLKSQAKAFLYPGVGVNAQGHHVCNRCGQGHALFPVECPICGRACYQCEECLPMGGSRSCSALWAFPATEPAVPINLQVYAEINSELEPSKIAAQLPPLRAKLGFALTRAQRDAAAAVLEQVASPGSSQLLIWAACGAGKTEVSFGAIAFILRQGGKVLFAIPRRDVVRELEPRLRKAFPGVRIVTLYGGCEQKYDEGDLILATTHQVLRFYHAFDLVVLDEVDAFPYRDSEMLRFAVARARQPGGKLILMTATPDAAMLRNHGQQITQVTIPARHHGFPLPVPELIINKQIKAPPAGPITLPAEVLDLLLTSVGPEAGSLFIFVPRVVLAEALAQHLRMALQLGIQSVHAKDPHRDQKIQAFKDGSFPILVTTSIMERGVTIANCNVIVFMANHEKIYTAGTLIQMAGRAGRTTAYPTGKVWFIAEAVSPAMKTAIQRIKALNVEAGNKGYLNLKGKLL